SRVPTIPPQRLTPYTTLFRSRSVAPIPKHTQSGPWLEVGLDLGQERDPAAAHLNQRLWVQAEEDHCDSQNPQPLIEMSRGWVTRSEEHTSELQSRGHLVCRLL